MTASDSDKPKIRLTELPAHIKDIPAVFSARSIQLAAIMRSLESLSVEANIVILAFPEKSEFHKRKVVEDRRTIEETFGEWLGQPIKVFGEWENRPVEAVVAASDQVLQDHEIRQSARKLAQLQAQIHQTTDDLKTLAPQLDQKRAVLAQLEIQTRKKERELVRLNGELETIRVETAKAEVKTSQIQAGLQRLLDTSAERTEHNTELEKAIRQHTEVVLELQKRHEHLLQENERAMQQRAELQARLEELQDRIEVSTRRLNEVTSKWASQEAEFQHTQQGIETAKAVLRTLQQKTCRPLWEAALRANLDAATIPLHTDWVLSALESEAPDVTCAFELEIAARTHKTTIPQGCDVSHGISRLFAGVIQARRAEQTGHFDLALDHLCAGWEAILGPETQKPPVTEGTSVPEVQEQQISISEVDATIDAQARFDTIPVSPAVRNTTLYVSGAWSTLTLTYRDTTILIDPGGDDYTLPVDPPDMVIITHAHYDHTRHLPALHDRFPDLPIIMTPETSELLRLSLAGWKSIHWKGRKLPFNTPLYAGDWKIVFRPAGHLLGAAMVELANDISILVTGDFCLRPVGGLSGPETALFQQRYDLLLMEAVHAHDTTFPTQSLQRNRQDRLIQQLNNAIDEGHSRILILAAALGDAQEVYQALWEHQHATASTKLREYRIYLKGLAHEVAQSYFQAKIWSAQPLGEPQDFPAQSIIISREADAHLLRRQIEQTQRGVVFEPYKSAQSAVSTDRNRRYEVDLHASLEELLYVSHHIQYGFLGLYHKATSGSPLERNLHSIGTRYVNVSAADQLELELR
ncbi:MAG: MBL fold metallo-hydrolase [Anaerolineae bacterium]|nr:MBL fold metallo-hydrolase [Anaerolineae bacterium]